MGISLAKAEQIICRNNKITGPFTYQGIELQSVRNSIITGNIIDGVSSADANCAGIGVSADSAAPGSISKSNLISGNQILNCKTGIFIGKSDATQVQGNTIANSSLAAIRSLGNRFDAVGNQFLDNETCIHNTSGPMDGAPPRK